MLIIKLKMHHKKLEIIYHKKNNEVMSSTYLLSLESYEQHYNLELENK